MLSIVDYACPNRERSSLRLNWGRNPDVPALTAPGTARLRSAHYISPYGIEV